MTPFDWVIYSSRFEVTYCIHLKCMDLW